MKRLTICILILFPLLMACSKSEYDISNGINTDITLFENEISVPIGSIGPLTIKSTLGGVSKIPGIGGMISEFLKQDGEGHLIINDEGNIFKINVYELESKLDDPGVPQTWNAGYQSAFVGGMAGLLGMVHLKTVDQMLTISASNPLKDNVAVTSSAQYSCSGTDGTSSFPIPGLNQFNLIKRADGELFTIEVPEDAGGSVNYISLQDLSLDLPANPVSRISDTQGNLFFSLDYKYRCHVAVGEDFSFPAITLPVRNISLAIGRFNLKKCQVMLEIENSIPLNVKVDNICVLKHKESEDDADVVDENIKVSGVTLMGGTLQKPASSTITLEFEAVNGTIPDIEGLKLDLSLSAEPGLGNAALSVNQGIYVKSSHAKLSGGITIPLNKK